MMTYLSSDFNKNIEIAREWEEQQAENEAESFEKAIKRLKPEDHIHQLEEENAELRHQIRNMNDMINQLREAINRNQEEYYE